MFVVPNESNKQGPSKRAGKAFITLWYKAKVVSCAFSQVLSSHILYKFHFVHFKRGKLFVNSLLLNDMYVTHLDHHNSSELARALFDTPIAACRVTDSGRPTLFMLTDGEVTKSHIESSE